jgi:hypothetical protein
VSVPKLSHFVCLYADVGVVMVVVVVCACTCICVCLCVWMGVFWRVTLDKHIVCGMHFCIVLHRHKIASVISVFY